MTHTSTPPASARRLTAIWAWVLVLMGASCANMPSTQSGFLRGGYGTLKPAPERQVWGVPDRVLMESTPGFTERVADGRLQKVMVDPVVYLPGPDARYRPTEAAASRLEGYATRRLRETLAEHFEIVDVPEPGAVRVRLAMTDLMRTNVWINSIMTVLLVPVDMGGVSGELEFVDAATGEPLLSMTMTREGNYFHLFEAFNRHGHVRHSLKKWAGLTCRMLRGK